MVVRGRIALVLVLMCAHLLVAPGASAAVTYEVEVGRLIKPTDTSAESMRFFPSTIKVHQGDTLHFVSTGFHGVTLLPVGQDAAVWSASFADGTDGAWSLFVPDPDDDPGSFKGNPRVIFPSLACGWPSQAPCDFDGSGDPLNGVLNSGLALFPSSDGVDIKHLDFSVAVNADPGQTFAVIDLVHPRMAMTVEVVAADVAASDPDDLAAESTTNFDKDKASATKLHNQYKAKKVSKVIKGKKTWTAWAGVETATVSLRRMYPTTLTITRGQKVQWLFSKNVFSPHTVTFPVTQAASTANQFPEIVCDPDGDSPDSAGPAPLPDTAPTSSSYPYCDSPEELELDAPDLMFSPVGDGVVKVSSDLESSGVRGRGFAERVDAFTLSFAKPTKRTGLSYGCIVHEIGPGSMKAKVVVKAPK